jgi:hypothetical protein
MNAARQGYSILLTQFVSLSVKILPSRSSCLRVRKPTAGTMSCSYVKAYKGEYLDCSQSVNDCMCFTDRDEFEEAVADSLADRNCTDEEFDALVKKEMAEYDPYWKPCIILNVDN